MKPHWMRRMGDTIDKTMAKGEDLQAEVGPPLPWRVIIVLIAACIAAIICIAPAAKSSPAIASRSPYAPTITPMPRHRPPGLCTVTPYCKPMED